MEKYDKYIHSKIEFIVNRKISVTDSVTALIGYLTYKDLQQEFYVCLLNDLPKFDSEKGSKWNFVITVLNYKASTLKTRFELKKLGFAAEHESFSKTKYRY